MRMLYSIVLTELIALLLSTSSLLAAPALQFSAVTNYTVGGSPYAIAAKDFNNDGKPDLVVANYPNNSLTVLLNDGGGRFHSFSNVPVALAPWSLAAGDFNKDGNADLVIAN